jgi:hypothetical protein
MYFKALYKITALIAMVILFSAAMANAQPQVSKPRAGSTGSWRILGTTQAKFVADHDAIIVAGPYDFFRKLKFKVTGASLNMQRMIVRFDDGGLPENIDVRYNIPQGGESRIIDLKGGKRKLKSVEFWYDTKGILNGKADVTLFGIK